MDQPLRVLFGGDVMLGRIVAQYLGAHGADYPLGGIAARMSAADVTVVNLECAITSSTQPWRGAPKAFYFGAPPEAAQSLENAGVDLVSLANNHALDFDSEGLLDTLRHLDERGIAHAGAGLNKHAACSPAFVEREGVKFGMAAYCDHQEDFAAGDHQPGIAYLDLADEQRALAEIGKACNALRDNGAHWPILSLHWGSNWAERPSSHFVKLARAAIDMGYGVIFGHSAHLFQGIEIYRGRPILYAAGDLVDDYYVDPDFRNDHQLLFELELTRASLLRINLYPVFIGECRTEFAAGKQFDYIARRMTRLCAELGTEVRRAEHALWINCA